MKKEQIESLAIEELEDDGNVSGLDIDIWVKGFEKAQGIYNVEWAKRITRQRVLVSTLSQLCTKAPDLPTFASHNKVIKQTLKKAARTYEKIKADPLYIPRQGDTVPNKGLYEFINKYSFWVYREEKRK
ncbi:MAG: hypothetical protein CL596_05240 [Alteromonas sp.]|nr:hypothetical protein [Alteromonas sp.]|tara:strand:- start:8172 stop:8558 length:387 start_codon:yes stop_codon:yes gene_type:complete